MNLFEARMMKRRTQWDLRIATGIHQTKISLIERGYVEPRKSEKLKLAKALNCLPEQIEWDRFKKESGENEL